MKQKRDKKITELELLDKSRLVVKQCRNGEPLYRKIAKEFHQSFELPELEFRKTKLLEIRNLRGNRLQKSEISLNMSRYRSIIRQRAAELEEERMRKAANVDFNPEKYHTKTLQKVLEQDEKIKQENIAKIHKRRLLAEKKMSYGMFVNQAHKPLISKKKRLEMTFIKQKIRHPVKHSRKVSSSAGYNELYNTTGKNPWSSTSQLARGSQISNSTLPHSRTPMNQLRGRSSLLGKKSINQGIRLRHRGTGVSTMTLNNATKGGHLDSTATEVPRTISFTDVVNKLHKKSRKLIIMKKSKRAIKKNSVKQCSPKRIHNYSKKKLQKDRIKRWKKSIRKMSHSVNSSNIERIKTLADMLENEADQRQELLNTTHEFDVKETHKINDMYLSAIKAKFALLDMD
ncbi:unnamed protein product [Moneuplotes crassus]|uniref:Uncharacterized protein n=1 Tax=Euplotes crassus TaxID=5936 RepID=A0AAD1Y319_EUPCR|nr:unnamed protein product [Moneuplotes crassus]